MRGSCNTEGCREDETVRKEETGQYSESTYASSGDQLAVVKLDTLKIVAGLQEVIQTGVRDERAVVQLQNG